MKQLLFSLVIAGMAVFNSNQSKAQCVTAVDLNGTTQYLHSPFNGYDFSTFTIEMWINSADFLANDVYVNWSRGSYIALGGWQADGSFNTWAEGLSPSSINSGSGTAPAVGTWHHVAFVYNGTNQIIYIDGTATATVPTTGSVNLNNGSTIGLVIGARFDMGQQFTNTTFDDVRIWNTARSAAQISSAMNSDLTGNESGLVAYYRFEDGIGSTTVTDLSGSGNTLTLTNMDPATDWTSGNFSTDSQGTDTQVSCGPFTWIDGNEYTTDNSTAMYTIAGGAAGGCDSIVTLNLTVNAPVDNTVTVTNDSIISSNDTSAGVQYQWIDCGTNTAISGETNQTFTATATGSYAVVVTGTNGCSDTSVCTVVSFASLGESDFVAGLNVAPNPTSGEVSISSANYTGEATITVINLSGKVIAQSVENISPNAPAQIDLSGNENGLYFVRISSANESHTLRVIKK